MKPFNAFWTENAAEFADVFSKRAPAPPCLFLRRICVACILCGRMMRRGHDMRLLTELSEGYAFFFVAEFG